MNIDYDKLSKLGLTETEKKYIADLADIQNIPGRIIFEGKNLFDVVTDRGIFKVSLSGKLLDRFYNGDVKARPVTGDWVWLKGNAAANINAFMINEIFPRRTAIMRKAAGDKIKEQLLAANIDIIFIVMALDGGRNFNLRGLERYLIIAWESGAKPVIIINKTDLCDNPGVFTHEAESVAPGVSIINVSAYTGNGIEKISALITQGITALFIGPSGVGKSTITNYILSGNIQKIGEIREDDKRGKHTTTARYLFVLESGGVIIDSPGLREIQLWSDSSSLDNVFTDIEYYAQNCKFRNCSHTQEPGCAVLEAIKNGNISKERNESYLKLKKETEYIEVKKDRLLSLEKKEKWKKIMREAKNIQKRKRGEM